MGKTQFEVKILNAITEACREMRKCPDDSISDIFNEMFEQWELDLSMDSTNFCIEHKE